MKPIDAEILQMYKIINICHEIAHDKRRYFAIQNIKDRKQKEESAFKPSPIKEWNEIPTE